MAEPNDGISFQHIGDDTARDLAGSLCYDKHGWSREACAWCCARLPA